MNHKKKNKVILDPKTFIRIDSFTAYAASAEYNALFKVDIDTKGCSYIGMFPGEKENGKNLYEKVYYIDEKIYFVPVVRKEKKIVVFDINSGSLEQKEDFSIKEDLSVESRLEEQKEDFFWFAEGKEKFKKDYLNRAMEKKRIIKEQDYFGLYDFIQEVTKLSLQNSDRAIFNQKESIGEQIFRRILSE